MDIQKIMDEVNDVDFSEMNKASWGNEQGILMTANEAQQLVDAWLALENLVEAKLLKDFQGETEEYKRLKDTGWMQAFQLFDVKKLARKQRTKLLDQYDKITTIIRELEDYIKDEKIISK